MSFFTVIQAQYNMFGCRVSVRGTMRTHWNCKRYCFYQGVAGFVLILRVYARSDGNGAVVGALIL